MKGLGGSGLQGYWGRHTVYQAGDPASHEHIPFNIILSADLPWVGYEQVKETACSELIANIIYDGEFVPGILSLEMRFRDPILMASMFLYKGLPTGWVGDGTDVMTFNFSTFNNEDKNLWAQFHVPDKSGMCKHLNLLYDGGQILSYGWLIRPGTPLIELVDLEFSECDENTQPINVDTGFDDGKFDKTGVAEVSTVVCAAKDDTTDESYFRIYVITSAFAQTTYNIWFDKAGDDTFTASPAFGTDVKCDISGAGDATSVAVIVAAAIDGISANVGAANVAELVTITNVNKGAVTDSVDIDSGLTILVTTQGKLSEVSSVVAKIANNITSGSYFTLQGISATWVRTNYYVWFNKDVSPLDDPAPTGYTAIEVGITTGETAQEVSDLIQAAIDGVGNLIATNEAGNSTTIRITNATAGDVIESADVDSGLTVTRIDIGLIEQNGGWAGWDGAYDASKGAIALSKDCVITLGNAAVSGLDIEECRLTVNVPKTKQKVQSSLKVSGVYLGSVDFFATLSGTLTGNDAFSEFFKAIGSKATAAFKIQYGTTKYLEFTNAYYEKVDPAGQLPSAGTPVKVTYHISPSANSVLTYYWKATEVDDPSGHITHTDT